MDGGLPSGGQRENDGRRLVRRRSESDPRVLGDAETGTGSGDRSFDAGHQPGGLRRTAFRSQVEEQGIRPIQIRVLSSFITLLMPSILFCAYLTIRFCFSFKNKVVRRVRRRPCRKIGKRFVVIHNPSALHP